MDQNQHVRLAQEAQYQPNPMMAPTILPTQTYGHSLSSSYPRQYPYDPQAMYQLRQEPLQQQLTNFWAKKRQEIEETTSFKTHSLPLARIKKIMKGEEGVRMVSAEASVVFAKACEMFMMELTIRASGSAEENQRKIIKKCDVASAISRTDVFDFLVDIVSGHNKIMEQQAFVGIPRIGTALTPTENVPYYQMPPHQSLVPGPPYGSSGMVVGMPVHYQNHPGLQTPTMGPTPNPQNSSRDSDS
ncbi:hypothetical protein JHK87_036787 [Glycine soja]|nr:hypothetical protein JHK87_036787 [Glycine soja]